MRDLVEGESGKVAVDANLQILAVERDPPTPVRASSAMRQPRSLRRRRH
jgi:hypothetical protein